jgi:hypothetical protein
VTWSVFKPEASRLGVRLLQQSLDNSYRDSVATDKQSNQNNRFHVHDYNRSILVTSPSRYSGFHSFDGSLLVLERVAAGQYDVYYRSLRSI